jgi:quinol monooxygenase YgiN
MGAESGPSVDLTIVTMTFDTSGPGSAEQLVEILAKYVVVSRMHPGCRNIDLCASVTSNGRLVVIEKWESPAAQRAHFDSEAMVEMAQSCRPLLVGPPAIELLDGISAHDLA